MLIELESVTKIYNQGQANEVVALQDISLSIGDNSMTCLRGASGCGKSTLLSIIGCVFQPTSGGVAIAGKQLSRLPDRFLTLHRRRFIGFIFQNFNILPALTVQENITLPLVPLGLTPARMQEKVSRLMEQFSIMHRRAISLPVRSPVANCSGLPLPGPWSMIRPLFLPMNRPRISTAV